MSSYTDYINLERQELLDLLQSKLDKRRFDHSLRVEETALRLAKNYHLDETKVSIASLLHDLMKQASDESSRQSIISDGLALDLLEYGNPIWHGPVAAAYAKKFLELTDSDILKAVANHTVGSDHMSDLEQLVFVADYIEPQRSFPGVDTARQLAEDDLEKVVAFASWQTIKHLLDEKQTIYPQSIHTYNAYSNLLREE